jgi:cation:H+ antiporter
VDSGVLTFFYVVYIALLSRMPPEEEPPPEEQPYVPRKILALAPRVRTAMIISMFTGGAVGLYLVADSFLSSMLGVASAMGVSYYIFVQWVAPFLSEFPEKVTAFYWAKRVTHAPMAIMNMVSSNINQWTMLVAMIPIVYSISRGQPSYIPLDESHRMEILLTIAQSLLGFLLLTDMRFRWYEAIAMFVLWLAQFIMPHWREEVAIIYFGWAFIHLILVLFGVRHLEAFRLIPKIVHGQGAKKE